ncbi:uncharacterized protein PG998_003352 [Apiospora kogelbergensis]|uniref:uncharacterized protein n=1 Tax=Apiospora kogelbergensis TaxID=1337665 RepID=UPI0031328204
MPVLYRRRVDKPLAATVSDAKHLRYGRAHEQATFLSRDLFHPRHHTKPAHNTKLAGSAQLGVVQFPIQLPIQRPTHAAHRRGRSAPAG